MTVVRLRGLGASDLDVGDCEPVAETLEQFTPAVEVLRPGLYCFAARGPARYFGGEQTLAALVSQAVADASATGRAQAGNTPAGRTPTDTVAASRPPAGAASGGRATAGAVPAASSTGVAVADGLFAAGLASRIRGVTVVPHGQARKFLAPLSVSCLTQEVSPLSTAADDIAALLDVLWRLGLRTLGDVAALSEADMLGRFAEPGLMAHRLANGLDDRGVHARNAPDDLSVEAEIDPPAERVEAVAFAARAAADEMVARLAGNGLDCVSVTIEAHSDSGHTSLRRWRHEFRFDAAAIVDRLRWQMEGWYRSSQRPSGPVAFVRITACEVVPAGRHQLGLWGERSEADERAARALARLQGLLGVDAVTMPRLHGGRRPADTGRRRPLDETAKGAAPAKAPWPGRLPSPSPVLVLNRPEAIEVSGVDGASVKVSSRGEASEAPLEVTDSAGRRRQVLDWAGPWPLDERWWHPRSRRRQARFQLVLDDGSAHLCVLESGRWWREATYD